MSYFKLGPKVRREELYNREDELNRLLKCWKRGDPITLVVGPRRVGKTSLVLTAINEKAQPSLIFDLTRLKRIRRTGFESFMLIVEEALNSFIERFSRFRVKLLRALRGRNEVRVTEHSVLFRAVDGLEGELFFKKLIDIIDAIAASFKVNVVLVFDEIQEARRIATSFEYIISYIYEYSTRLPMTLISSQEGLMHKLLKFDDVESPLYKAKYTEIKLTNFTEKQAVGFLERGLEYHGIRASLELLKKIAKAVGCNPGWLTIVGNRAVKARRIDEKLLEKVTFEISTILQEELESFLELRPLARERYLFILRSLASSPKSWKELKSSLEARLNKKIGNKNFSNYLHNLVDAGFIIRKEGAYQIVDPLLKHALYV